MTKFEQEASGHEICYCDLCSEFIINTPDKFCEVCDQREPLTIDAVKRALAYLAKERNDLHNRAIPEDLHKQTILIDVDHVISDAFWRDPMIAERDYDAYHKASMDDRCDPDIRQLLNRMAPHYSITGLTARPEKWRKLTMDWMLRHEITIHGLIMRPDSNFDPSPKVKLELVKTHYADRMEKIAFIIDDRDDVAEIFRGANFNVFQYHMKRREA